MRLATRLPVRTPARAATVKGRATDHSMPAGAQPGGQRGGGVDGDDEQGRADGLRHGEAEDEGERGHDHEPAADAEQAGQEPHRGADQRDPHGYGGVDPSRCQHSDAALCVLGRVVGGDGSFLADPGAAWAGGDHPPGGDQDEQPEPEQQEVAVNGPVEGGAGERSADARQPDDGAGGEPDPPGVGVAHHADDCGGADDQERGGGGR